MEVGKVSEGKEGTKGEGEWIFSMLSITVINNMDGRIRIANFFFFMGEVGG